MLHKRSGRNDERWRKIKVDDIIEYVTVKSGNEQDMLQKDGVRSYQDESKNRQMEKRKTSYTLDRRTRENLNQFDSD